MSRGSTLLSFFDNHWPTNKGAWYPGEAVRYRELSLFEDFAEKGWMDLLIYGIRGEMPDPKVSRLMEQMWIMCTSFPDPRLWNNRVAALAGTTRSTGALALAAATAVSEASIYGRKPDILVCEFLLETCQKIASGADLDSLVVTYLKAHRAIPGFGRPIIAQDERVKPVLALAAELGLDQGPHLALVKDIEQVLKRKRMRIQANISSYSAALMTDLGFSPRDFYYTVLLSFTGGIMPCYLDAVEKPEGVFFPLSCEKIKYQGVAIRRLGNDK